MGGFYVESLAGTGSASGLGRNIAEGLLASGDRLAATARDARRLEGLVEKYGDHVRTAPLDVADEGGLWSSAGGGGRGRAFSMWS